MSENAAKASFRLAQAAWLVMLVMILSGGTVTSTGSGLAVPDWPTTFGEGLWVYDFLGASRSVLIEHGHRLWGTFLGALVTALTLTLWISRAPRGARILGTAVFAAVVCQGILGGQRVALRSQLFAMFHGIFAQACFVLMSVLVVTLDARRASRPAATPQLATGSISNLSLFLTVSAGMQLFFGVMLRHTGHGLGWHLAGAAAVAYAAWQLARCVRQSPEAVQSEWRRPARQLTGLVALQVLLGGASWAARLAEGFWALKSPGIPEIVTTLHVGMGALILARAATMTVLAWSRMEEPEGTRLAGGGAS